MRLVQTLAMLGSPILIVIAASLENARHANPPWKPEQTISENLSLPPAIDAILRRSCFDCHSSETRWPWYSKMAGIGYLVERDVNGGREAMNFSEWSTGAGKTSLQGASMLLAACEAVRKRRMPKSNYMVLHPNAALKAAEVDEFCGWAQGAASELVPVNGKP